MEDQRGGGQHARLDQRAGGDGIGVGDDDDGVALLNVGVKLRRRVGFVGRLVDRAALIIDPEEVGDELILKIELEAIFAATHRRGGPLLDHDEIAPGFHVFGGRINVFVFDAEAVDAFDHQVKQPQGVGGFPLTRAAKQGNFKGHRFFLVCDPRCTLSVTFV